MILLSSTALKETVTMQKAQKGLISYVKTETEKRSGVFFVVSGLVLTGMEKVLETEFTCPCKSGWSAWFSAAYFLAPFLLLFVVMLKITGFKWVCSVETVTSVLQSLVPPVTWLVLLFMDGRYYVCARTYWSGHLVKDDSHIPEKWCKPDDTTLAAELEEKTRWWFSQSQFWGEALIISVVVILLMYHCTICSCSSCGRSFLRSYCLCCLHSLTSLLCCNKCCERCRERCCDRHCDCSYECGQWVCHECNKDPEKQNCPEREPESSETVPLANLPTSSQPGNEEK
ncbi:calcium homeostasis modulator protein 6-like [Sphaeramia orbicularis]|uniref:calcium homeostasis modulator protein 6-like n=1 Tax=Sphaeramia orbicularis TaxID=375764 RepID=UPI00117DEBE6|nr:calcium homeostasis modulator protein 6-like [Sphaeramia orbicularis]